MSGKTPGVFREELASLVRWARLGLLDHSLPSSLKQQRIELLTLAERLGLSDGDMARAKEHPAWNGRRRPDMMGARQMLRDARIVMTERKK